MVRIEVNRTEKFTYGICAIIISVMSQLCVCFKEDGVIYILLWTAKHDTPFVYLETGRRAFISRNCTYQNCYVTDQISHLGNVLDFDVVLINRYNMHRGLKMPDRRSPTQNYIFVSEEPAGLHKIPKKYNKWFNLTWTYKLDSDSVFPYIVVKDERDQIIGPKQNMHWIDIKHMKDTSAYVRNKLRKKRLAAAWFVSNCEVNDRLIYGRELQKELAKLGHRLDIYGNCGDKFCPTQGSEDMDECYALVESFYYFYLAFENSFCEDYVTEKILTGLEHFSVPVVLGGANYTRFMPDGIFLRANGFNPADLAKEMVRIINDKKRYYEFFKWHGYYSFHHTAEDRYQHQICGLCAMLNNKTLMTKRKAYNTNLWWNEWRHGIPSSSNNIFLSIDEDEPQSAFIEFASSFYKYFFDF